MIRTILGSVTGNLGLYVVGAAVIAIGVYIYIQDTRIKSLTGDLKEANQMVTVLDNAVKTQKDTIDTIEQRFNETVKGTRQLNTEVARLREEQNEIEAQYNEYRGRLAKLSAKKPGLVERLANNAFDDILQSYSDATDRSNSTSNNTCLLYTSPSPRDRG